MAEAEVLTIVVNSIELNMVIHPQRVVADLAITPVSDTVVATVEVETIWPYYVTDSAIVNIVKDIAQGHLRFIAHGFYEIDRVLGFATVTARVAAVEVGNELITAFGLAPCPFETSLAGTDATIAYAAVKARHVVTFIFVTGSINNSAQGTYR